MPYICNPMPSQKMAVIRFFKTAMPPTAISMPE